MFSKHSYMYDKHDPQIARVDIVQFKHGRNVPVCAVELEWTGSGEPKPLSHQVKIFGAKKPAHFYLRYYPQAVGEFYLCANMHMCACLNFHLITILVIRYFSCQVPQQTRYCTPHCFCLTNNVRFALCAVCLKGYAIGRISVYMYVYMLQKISHLIIVLPVKMSSK